MRLSEKLSSTNKQAAIGFIFITLLIDVIGFGIVIPVFPSLIGELKGVDVATAAKYGSWLSIAYAVVQFFFAPIIGNLSDQYGRRKVILFSLFGFSIDYLFLAFAPSYEWLFFGRVIAGITGASFSSAAAYIADISTAETRAKNFGMIGAAFGLGFIIGPVTGGFLGLINHRLPFIAAACLSFLNWMYGYFILPESLPIDKRRKFEWKKANAFASFTYLKKYPSLYGLVIAIFFLYLGAHALQSNWNYFTQYRFHWTEKTVGISLGVVGILVAIVQGGLIRYINPKIGNVKSIYIGFAFYALGMLLFAFAWKDWMLFAILAPYCFGGIAQPALQATISAQIPNNEQGIMQGTLASLMSFALILGPAIMNNLFYFFTHDAAPFQFPGAPFLLSFFLYLISIVFVNKTLKHFKH